MTTPNGIGTHADITLDEILQGSPVPTFVIDAGHRVTHWNRACELILGHSAASIVGTSDQWKPFYPQPRPVMADLVLSGQIETQVSTYYDKKFRRSTIVPGSYEAEDFFPNMGASGTWLYFTAAPLKDRRGRIVGAVETLQDISDRKRAEAAQQSSEEGLHREHERLRTIIEHFPGGITLLDAKLDLVENNDAFRHLLGLPADLLGRLPLPLEDLLRYNAERGEYGAGDPQALVAQMLERIRDTRGCFEHTRPDGTVLEIKAAEIPGGGFVTSYTDITERKRIEQRLGELLDEQRAIFDNAHVGIAYLRDRRIINCNQHLAELFGFEAAAELIGHDTSFQYGDNAEWVAQGEVLYRRLGETGISEDEVLLRRRDGSPVWCVRSARLLEPGQPQAGSIWVYSDISEQKRQHRQLELARTVFENSTEALLITDGDNRIISVNRAFTAITGYPAAEVIGRNPRQFRSDRHDDAFFAGMWQTLLAEGHWAGEVWDRRRSGEVFAKWLSIAVVRDNSGSITNYVAAFSDITQRKAAEEHINFLAHHDTLTGLPNRVLLQSRFEHSLGQARRNGTGVAMLFLDLDQFKRVNDSLGHRIGDRLLVGVVERLKKCLRDSDTISRQGGDEFVILLEDAESPTQVARVAAKIIDSLDPAFDIEGHNLSTSISIGVALYPEDGRDFDTLLKKSDTAMYHAKASGRSTFSFYNERMNADADQRLRLHNLLRRALSRNEFQLQFQPQVVIRSGRIFGAEALLRWHTADGETVLPDRFIPIAEESGLIIPIGDWVIGTAFRQARLWQDAGVRLRLGINVSGLHIYRVDLPRQLDQALQDAGISPEMIEIELTESVLMQDAVTAREVIGDIKRLGFQVAIDDFGTGYSSLAYLKKFQVDKLKIDRSFVTDLVTDEEDQAITRAVIGLARALKLRAIAEGVETSEQMDFLKKHGCHEAQGFLISRPTSAESVTRMMTRH